MSTIDIGLSEEILALFGETPEERGRAVREAAVLELYRRHDITGSEAAKLLEMNLSVFLRFASAHGIPVIDSSPEQWAVELRAVYGP